MREIKFRGKRIDNGEFVYGFYHKDVTQSWIYCAESESLWGFREVEDSTVGEYTGLKDKNGKEIYEEDLVNLTGIIGYGQKTIEKHKVIFSEGKFGVFNGYDFIDLFEFINAPKGNAVEVIGNIYEHSHLLDNK